MANKGREFLRDLKMKERIKELEKEKSLFPLSQLDKEIDKKNGIQRKPWIGCLISSVGSIVVWSLIYWLWVSL